MKAVIKEGRADQFIQHAQEVFFNKGYAHTTISDICKKAECSRTTLYSYFESKENLYLAVIEKAFKKFLGYFGKLKKEGASGFEQVLIHSRGYIRFSKEFPKHYETIHDFYGIIRNAHESPLQTEVQTHIKDSPNFEGVKELSLLPFKLLTKEIQRGLDEGNINRKYSAEEHMINIWAYLKGISDISPNLGYVFSPQKLNMEKKTESFIRAMLEI
ncbi:MAG: TetR/AcrR family transcriptional regulator [Bacteroidia bacterium]|nr:TetR/AcrR family transcriptional regulator [Bacteroidia bacterium]